MAMSTVGTLEDFLAETKLKATAFSQINISWEELQKIGAVHAENYRALETIGKTVAATLHDCENVHSVKSRVKSPIGVMEKIARKKIERLAYTQILLGIQEKLKNLQSLNLPTEESKPKLEALNTLIDEAEIKISKSQKWNDVSTENYLDVITDLVGVRALHLYASDCASINAHIFKTWDKKADEHMLIYVRKGEEEEVSDELKEQGKVEAHKHGYRSIHHIIQTKPENKVVNVEIQVRTIFQEGWSEVHHRLTYKKQDIDSNIEVFLNIFNLFAGGADVMGSYARDLASRLEAHRSEKELLIKTAEEASTRRELERTNLEKLIDDLSNSTNEKDKKSIRNAITKTLTAVVGGREIVEKPLKADLPKKPINTRIGKKLKNPSPYHLDNLAYLNLIESQKSFDQKISDTLGTLNNPLINLGVHDWNKGMFDSVYGLSQLDILKKSGLNHFLGLDPSTKIMHAWLDNEKFLDHFRISDNYHQDGQSGEDPEDFEGPEDPEPVT
jgi:ppGpp synthetase/RelA/SpoT-type nucleotidyltranferase